MCTAVNLPKPPELLSRLIVMCGNPHAGGNRGEYVLAAMKALSPNLREELVDLWDAVIPKLLSYLSGQCYCISIAYGIYTFMYHIFLYLRTCYEVKVQTNFHIFCS